MKFYLIAASVCLYLCVAHVDAAEPRRIQTQRAGGRRGSQQDAAGKSSISMAYIMAAGVEDVVGRVEERFSCDGRDYGYYADTGNNCQVYHVCVPPVQHFTFFCNNGTIFDQKLMTCQEESQATPCGESERFYVLNQNFGVLDNNQLIYVE